MRTLKYAILGLVNRKPTTGYDIAKEFKEKELANFWSAKHSQIYPELKKLVEEGHLEFDVEISGEVLEKKVYRITAKGRREFRNWLTKDEAMEPTFKDKFRLRMYFAENMKREDMLKLLKSQLIQRRKKLEFLLDKETVYTEMPPCETENFGDFIVLRGAVLREQAYVKWLEEAMEAVEAPGDGEGG